MPLKRPLEPVFQKICRCLYIFCRYIYKFFKIHRQNRRKAKIFIKKMACTPYKTTTGSSYF